ncbi:hypothetical protein [Actinophytocola oryzae]|nr:hypothetical protein [Actinophytocola oryzae]
MFSRPQPRYRNVFGVDVEGSTTRNNGAKARMRDAMYTLVTQSFVRNGITADDHDRLLDSGDGLLALLRAVDRIPKTLLLHGVVPTLSRLIDEHNTRRPADCLRLRAVLHAGEVHHDTRAPFGETLDVAFRLLDSPVTKRALRRTTAPLVLAVSDDVHNAVVRHQYDDIDPLAFTAFMTKRNATTWDSGWLHVPGEAGTSFLGPNLAGHPSVSQ